MRLRTVIALLAVVVSVLVVSRPVGAQSLRHITGKQIKNGTVSGKDIRDGALTGTDVRDDALTGADVAESSLGVVPSAGDAATLGGRPPSAFGTSTVEYRLPTGASSTATKYSFPGVGAGRYLVTYTTDLLLSSGSVLCSFTNPVDGTGPLLPSHATSNGVYATADAAGVVTVPVGTTPELRCDGDAFTLLGGAGSAVSFTAIDQLRSATATQTR